MISLSSLASSASFIFLSSSALGRRFSSANFLIASHVSSRYLKKPLQCTREFYGLLRAIFTTRNCRLTYPVVNRSAWTSGVSFPSGFTLTMLPIFFSLFTVENEMSN